MSFGANGCATIPVTYPMPCVFTLFHEKPANPGVAGLVVTNTGRCAVNELYVAVMVVAPFAFAVSPPDAETLAAGFAGALHAAVAVTSLVVLSL